MQKKFDEFFNRRTDPPIFKLRLHHHDSANNDPPNSDAELFQLDGLSQYQSISRTDLGQLPNDYYFDEINSTLINVNLYPSRPAPLELKITFETDGPTEMPTTTSLLSDMDFLEFSITLNLTLTYVPGSGKVDLFSWVPEMSTLKATPIGGSIPPLVNVRGTFLGQTVTTDIAALDWEDYFIQQIVNVHIVTKHSYDFGDTAQRAFRRRIFETFEKDGDELNKIPSVRDSINRVVNRWLMGEDGSYFISDFQNDGQTIAMTYTVPANIVNPFPARWSSPGTTHPALDFSPGTLANIDHIVVLTMENRSFDQMLGYLSLPEKNGGMGRTDVDGLKGPESNFYNGTSYPSFPFAPGDTRFFAPDPEHDSSTSSTSGRTRAIST